MRVQRVVMPVTGGVSWTVIDDSWAPVAPAERYLAHLAGVERSPNTVRAYAFGLRFWFEFLEFRGLVWDPNADRPGGIDPVWLRKRYVDDGQPIIKIAREAGVSRTTVHRAMVAHDIARRPRSSASASTA